MQNEVYSWYLNGAKQEAFTANTFDFTAVGNGANTISVVVISEDGSRLGDSVMELPVSELKFQSLGAPGGGWVFTSQLADLDKDSDLDLILAGSGTRNVFFNDGGQITSANSITFPNGSSDIAIGDVDGDTENDLVVASDDYGDKPVNIHLNNGDGTFSDAVVITGLLDVGYLDLADIDGDSDLDLVAGVGDSGVVVYTNDAGVFTNTGQTLGGSTDASEIVLEDMNGDGHVDIVAGFFWNQPDKIFLNDGAGVFTDSGQALGTEHTQDVDVGDVDGDGDLDIVAGNYASATVVYLNDGAANFTAGDTMGIGGTTAIELGDVDGDGDLDLVQANQLLNFIRVGSRVYLNDGTGVFRDSFIHYDNDEHFSTVIGDLDGDGLAEIGLGGRSSGLIILDNQLNTLP